MDKMKAYEKPWFEYWKAEQLDTIEATMTGGGGGQLGIYIPEQYGNGPFTVTFYDETLWNSGTSQNALYEMWSARPAGTRWNDGIAVLDGLWLIACTSTFGAVGDIVSFYLGDPDGFYGVSIDLDCVIADIKSQSDPDCNLYGHDNGQRILEFEVSKDRYIANGSQNPGSNGWKTEWGGQRVSRVFNYHVNVLNL
ncbi:MAG: hypothetical protein LBS98_07245 [Coriobacteriales bacterium]|jgi:hypothetical protein|nr:hypothetical protein [Coriobacteriales bacterium]